MALTSKDHVAEAVRQRVASYAGAKDGWYVKAFVPAIERLGVHVLAWEHVIRGITEREPESAPAHEPKLWPAETR